MPNYDESFFAEQKGRSHLAAEQVLPELLGMVDVKSAVDFGCGVGTWLRVLKNLGISKVKGLDGFGGRTTQLQIDANEFIEADLASSIDLKERFDIAISLEVAEHLPPASSEQFVDTLCRHSDLVMFSAAIPRQDGVGHINERWQDFWAELFVQRGYIPCLAIRNKIWNLPQIPSYYKQNIVLYVKKDSPYFSQELAPTSAMLTSVVHPELFSEKADYGHVSLSKIGLVRIVIGLPGLIKNAVAARLFKT